jgi:hypothetical protein
VGYLQESPEIVSGFAGSNARTKIKNSMSFGVEPWAGEVLFIWLTIPLFRSFWENGKLFFVNALFFVDNDDLTR